MRETRVLIGVAAALLLSSASSAQEDISLSGTDYHSTMIARLEREHACRMGAPLADEERIAASRLVHTAMERYFAAVASGPEHPADVSSAFVPSREAHLVIGSLVVRGKQLRSVKDPFARVGSAIHVALIVAGDGKSAQGQWILKDFAGEPRAVYLAEFQRAADWRLRSLRILAGNEMVTPPVQYCHRPGDVQLYRARISNREKTNRARFDWSRSV